MCYQADMLSLQGRLQSGKVAYQMNAIGRYARGAATLCQLLPHGTCRYQQISKTRTTHVSTQLSILHQEVDTSKLKMLVILSLGAFAKMKDGCLLIILPSYHQWVPMSVQL